MNDFDRDDKNLNEEQTTEKASEEKIQVPDVNSEKPEFTEQPTYSRVYTPGEDGYTHVTKKTEESPQYTTPMYSSYSAPESKPVQTEAKANKPRKKRSRASAAIVLTCAFVLVAVLFSMAGFLFAKGRDVIGDLTTNGDQYEETNTDELPDGKENTTVKVPGKDSATISKDTEESAVKPTIVNGKVGELMTMSQVAALVKDSVVEINTEQKVTGGYFGQYIQSGAGSGVIIAKEGYVVTNNHVIDGASKITVKLTNGKEYEATLVGTDAGTDIAVLKIEPDEKLTVAELGSSARLELAEEVIVIGNPLGSLGGTITNGIVSALAREITIDGESMTLIQTNAAVNPGNSGGGMFDLYGKLIGVVNAKSSGTDVEGLGFAIPIDTAYNTVTQIMEYGYVRGRIDHGLELIDITDLFTAASYHVNAYGVYVYESKYTDEIKNGDRITSMNGREVSTSSDIKTALKGCKVGDTVEVTVARSGKLVTVNLTLREYVPSSAGNVDFTDKSK